MRHHPYVRSALIGLVVGIVAGAAVYGVLRLFGTHANRYLLGAIVVFCVPGSVMLSEIVKNEEFDEVAWEEEQARLEAQQRPVPPSAD